jgi:2-keto-4-pentenoate hydratase/2-oxohepta-3-ene-1,7-dioic acid hydratase in catechol pathway
MERLATALERGDLPVANVDGLRIGAPVVKPEKIVCVGLNYADHVTEAGFDLPKEPLLFFKAPNTIVGPHDEVLLPLGATKVDWEVEIALVIGNRARYLETPQAGWDSIAGLCVSNDLSERSFQLERGGEWAKGKSCETFQPLGPELVTLSEVSKVKDIGIWLRVNGVEMQRSSSSQMLWDAGFLVWYISQFMVLEPGDIVNTGTPGGVGNLQKPARFLSTGDVMELGADGLGVQRLTVGSASQ